MSTYGIFTSDNPRDENPDDILYDITDSFDKNNYEIDSNRENAIKKGIQLLDNNDILMVLGKGHEEFIIVGNKKIPYNDHKAVLKIIESIELVNKLKVVMMNNNIVKTKTKNFTLNKINCINLNNAKNNSKSVQDYMDIQDYSIVNDENSKTNEVKNVNSKTSSKTDSIVKKIDEEEKRKQNLTKEYKKKQEKCKRGSIEYRNNELEYKVDYAGYGTREGVVAAAKYLSETGENREGNETQVPYLWGGKYNKFGIPDSWGKNYVTIWAPGSDMQPQGSYQLDGLDCSGFVTWCLINGGYKAKDKDGVYIDYTERYNLLGKQVDFTMSSFNKMTKNKVNNEKEYEIKAGDLLYRPGHIAIITDINRKYGTITVAEERGYPTSMVITTMKLEDYVKQAGFTKVIVMDDYYSNKANVTKRK